MFLEELEFIYRTPAQSFSGMRYGFRVVSQAATNEGMLADVKEEFDTLDRLACGIIHNTSLVKKATGTVTHRRLESGFEFEYKPTLRGFADVFSNKLVFSLSYSISYMSEKVNDMHIVLSHNERNQGRILSLYDFIMSQNGLALSDQAQASRKNIRKLREGIPPDKIHTLLTS